MVVVLGSEEARTNSMLSTFSNVTTIAVMTFVGLSVGI